MIMKEDNVDFLFDKKEDEDLFNLDSEVFEQISDDIEILINKTNRFIDKRVHPKARNKLKYLINKQENKIYALNHIENQLYYRNGFADGISIIITALSTK